MAGGGDPDNRRAMTWSGTSTDQEALRDHVTKLIGIRKAHPALRHGTRQQVWLTGEVYAYSMSQAADVLTVVLNRSDTDQTFQLSGGPYTDLLGGASFNGASIKVPARSALVLQ